MLVALLRAAVEYDYQLSIEFHNLRILRNGSCLTIDVNLFKFVGVLVFAV